MHNSNKKQLGILIATILLFVAAMANVFHTSAQTAVGTLDPLKLSGTFIVPRDPNNTIGSSTVNGYFNGITVSSCTGCGAGSSPVIFKANGGAFVTTSTINFQQGSNITITTSSDGTYTITGAAGGGGGSVSTSSAITINNFPFWTSVGGGLSGTSTLTVSSGDLTQAGNFNVFGVVSSTELRTPSSTITALTLTRIPNLTSNGFVKTGGGNGTLSIDTNTYLTSAVTSLTALSPLTVSAASGAITIQVATSSASTNGILTSSDWSTFNGKGNVTVLPVASVAVNTIPYFTTAGSSTIATTTFTYASGGLAQNATQLIDGGGNWKSNIIAPANTTVVGNLIQGGQITVSNVSTTLSAGQFCTGGGFVASGTAANITVTLPALSSVSSTCGPLGIGTFNQNIIFNNSTNTVSVTPGSGMTAYYAAGTPTVLPPGASWLATGNVVYGTSTALQILYNSYSATSTITVDNLNSRTGFNTTQPSSTVHIKGTAGQTTDLFRVASSSNSTSSFLSISATGTSMFDDLITGTSTSQFGEPLGPHCFIIYGTDSANAATSTPTYTWMKNHAWATSTSACFN